MRVELTRYSVPGWGVGELWTGDGLVLAHEFHFEPVSDTGARSASKPGRVCVRESAAPQAWLCEGESDDPCGKNGTLLTQVPLDKNRCLTPPLLIGRFAAFFAGEDVRLDDVPLDLEWTTPFQHAVASTLRGVPRGEVVSYGELAALAGYPGAARAVGTFCARNRFMLLVPCHRVIGANGVGGYGSAGVGVKRRLLALEGVAL